MIETDVPPGMGRCEITGQILPGDELVTLHGKRVCAEGKAILLERLKAGEVLPGEAERPTDLRRFGCIFLDNILLAVPSLIIGFVAAFGAAATSSTLNLFVGLGQLISVVITLAYFTLLHGSRAQTLGKIAGKLKVVRLDNRPMDMKTAFIRALAYQGLAIILAVLVMLGLSLVQVVGSIIVYTYLICDAVSALVDRNQQRTIHDRIAGTRVVMLNT